MLTVFVTSTRLWDRHCPAFAKGRDERGNVVTFLARYDFVAWITQNIRASDQPFCVAIHPTQVLTSVCMTPQEMH